MQPTQAQISTNIYWANSSDQNPVHTIYYSKKRALTWQDFTAAPETTGNKGAVTVSGFGYKASLKSASGKGQLNIAVFCYFTKDKSWVKPHAKTGYVLAHEQRHFDISFIAAQDFIEKAKKLSNDAITCNKSLPQLYAKAIAQMNKMQQDYDTQTKNGQSEAMQEKWNQMLQAQLSRFTN